MTLPDPLFSEYTIIEEARVDAASDLEKLNADKIQKAVAAGVPIGNILLTCTARRLEVLIGILRSLRLLPAEFELEYEREVGEQLDTLLAQIDNVPKTLAGGLYIP